MQKPIFDYTDYKVYLTEKISEMPKSGWGALKKFADHLGMHTTRITHVIRGHENFTLEQACGLAELLGLNTLETKYFLLMVQYERAGTELLRKNTLSQLVDVQKQSLSLGKRLVVDKKLGDLERAFFYSNWYFSAIRMLTSLEKYSSIEAISERLALPPRLVDEVLTFLVQKGLCLKTAKGIKMGPVRTHVEASSVFATRHHMNWRLKAMERHPRLKFEEELAFTAPMSLSRADAKRVREQLAQTIEKIVEIAAQSKSEKVACLNIDWFDF